MKHLIFLFILFAVMDTGCKKDHPRNAKEAEIVQFATDRIQTPDLGDGHNIDRLFKYYDIPLDKSDSLLFHQSFIAWGKDPGSIISLNQIESIRQIDGVHYYLIMSLMRRFESRNFKYLIEICESGAKRGLRYFYMFETSPTMRTAWIEKKSDHVTWMVRSLYGKCEWTGKTLKYTYKIPL